MRARLSGILIALTLFALLAVPLGLAAQDETAQAKTAQHHHYQLMDLGTFGGPNSSLPLVFYEVGATPATAQAIASNGVVTGTADTSMPDPLCFVDDCLYPHAFRWKKGVTTDLGALPGAQWSSSNWISGNGLIAGISENGDIDPLLGLPEGRAVLWQGNSVIDLGTLTGGYESFAFGVNNRGQVVGSATNGTPDPYSYYYAQILGISNGGQTRAFVWDKQNGMRDLGTLGGPDAWAAFANENGQVAGISLTNFTPNPDNGPTCAANVPSQDPFIWDSSSGMIDIGSFGGTCGAPQAMNNRGQVVGGSYLADNLVFHPFLWDRRHDPRLKDLGTFGGNNGLATWINESEQIVGSADFPGNKIHHAALWYHGVMTDLGTVGTDPCSRAVAINAKGQIVGGSTSCQTFLRAFIWENGGPMVDLNTLVASRSDLTLTEAVFINDAGEIVGNGVLPNGDAHAFVLIPCDGDHPHIQGCDYSMVEGAVAQSTNSAARPLAVTPQITSSPKSTVNQIRNRWIQHYRLPTQRTAPQS